MIVTKKGNSSRVSIYSNGHQIERVQSIEYQGIIIDENLNWKKQIKNIESKLSQANGIISKLRHYVYYDCLRSFYFAKIYSHL